MINLDTSELEKSTIMIRNIFIIGLILVGLTNCKQANKEEIEQVQEQEKFDETSAAIAEQFSGMVATASIEEVAAMLESMGADFNADFVNDPAKVETYLADTVLMGANLGIYYVDIIYAAANEQSDLARSLFTSAQTLSNGIGVGRSFDQAILDRFEGNLNDDQKELVQNTLKEASKNLNTNNRPRVTSFVLAGVLLERLHILGSIIDAANDLDLDDEQKSLLITPAMKMAVQQRENFAKVVEYININRTPSDPPYFRDLNSITNEFDALVEVAAQLDRKETVDPSVLNGLFAAVAETRRDVTEPGE